MKTNKLSFRELQVIEQIAWGNSYGEVAEILEISPATVDVHLKNIKTKTGLQKITELACIYLFKKYHLPLCDISGRAHARIAAALLCLSVFTVVFNTTNMIRVFAGNGRPSARVASRNEARRSREDYYFAA